MTARFAKKASFHSRCSKFSTFLFFFCFSARAKTGHSFSHFVFLCFFNALFQIAEVSLDAMFSATVILVFAMLRCAVTVFGNPLLTAALNNGLEGLRKTRCEVSDQFVSYFFKPPRGLYSGRGTTIPDKRVGTRSKFCPPPAFNVDNQVIFFPFLLEKTR